MPIRRQVSPAARRSRAIPSAVQCARQSFYPRTALTIVMLFLFSSAVPHSTQVLNEPINHIRAIHCTSMTNVREIARFAKRSARISCSNNAENGSLALNRRQASPASGCPAHSLRDAAFSKGLTQRMKRISIRTGEWATSASTHLHMERSFTCSAAGFAGATSAQHHAAIRSNTRQATVQSDAYETTAVRELICCDPFCQRCATRTISCCIGQ